MKLKSGLVPFTPLGHENDRPNLQPLRPA